MGIHLSTLSGIDVPDVHERLVALYRAVFTAPPWDEDEASVVEFRTGLAADALRPGFRVVLAYDESGDLGFGTAWTTPEEFPTGRAYDSVRRALGPAAVSDFLEGATEVDELAVSPTAQVSGVVGLLLDALADSAADGRCWLLTWRRASQAMHFYKRRGWHQIAPDTTDDDVAVFVGQRHPGLPTSD